MEDEKYKSLNPSRTLYRLLANRENQLKLVKVPEFCFFVFYWGFIIWTLAWAGGHFNFSPEGFLVITGIFLFLFFTGFILTTSRKNNPKNEKILVSACRFILWAVVILAVIQWIPLALPTVIVSISEFAGMGAFFIIPLMSGVVTGSKVKIFD